MRDVPPRGRGLAALTGSAGAVAFGLSYRATARPWAHLGLFAFFTATLVALYALPSLALNGGQVEDLQVDETLFVPMALLLSPVEAMAAYLIGVTVRHLRHRRGVWEEVLNAGQLSVALSLGLLVAHGLAGGGSPLAVRIGWALVGAVLFAALNAVLMSGALSYVRPEPFAVVARQTLAAQGFTLAGSLSLGVVAAMVGLAHPTALPIVVVPIGVLQMAYANALGQRRERARMEELYRAAGEIRSGTGPDEVVDMLLAAARRLLDAQTAEVVAGSPRRTPASGAPELLASLGGGRCVRVRDRRGGGVWHERDRSVLRALATVASGALHQAQLFARLQAITDSLDEGVLSLSPGGEVVFANPAAVRILGRTAGEMQGRPLHDIVHGPTHPCAREARCDLSTSLGESARSISGDDEAFCDVDGNLVPVEYSLRPLRDDPATGAVLAFRDVRERKVFEAQLRHQAFHDPLTELPNRVLFLDRMERTSRQAARSGGVFAVLFIDLDRFKLVNDSLGHAAGDRLLQEVARRLSACTRGGETLARFGGDEFTVLLEDVSGAHDATGVAHRILDAVRLPFEIEGRRLTLSASIGVVLSSTTAATPGELLAQADTAMYMAKARGKDCHVVFDPASEAEALARLDLEIALRDAVEGSQLELYYQPIYHLGTGALSGVEALVRWRHPNLGLLMPSAFISMAEETGLILPIGRWVLEEACRQARRWADADGGPLSVSVNLSARQFQQPGLVHEVREAVGAAGVDPSQLCLEITESVIMDDANLTTAALAELKGLGVRLAIDDFGTGYSSLSYLKRFPVDSVKIDRAFVDGLGVDRIDTEVIAAVVRLTGVVGMDVVAEGVSTRDQEEHLARLGCSYGQGFLLGRPMSARQIDELIGGRWGLASAG